jgi:hypothetical protein
MQYCPNLSEKPRGLPRLVRRVVRAAVPQAKNSVYRAAWYLKLPVKSDLPRLFPVVDRDAFDPFSFRVS